MKATLTILSIIVLLSVFLFGYMLNDLANNRDYEIARKVIDLPVYEVQEVADAGVYKAGGMHFKVGDGDG